MIKFCQCVMSCLIGTRTFSDKAQNRRLSSSSCKIPRMESQCSVGDIWIAALFLKLAQQILHHKFCLPEQIPLLLGLPWLINWFCWHNKLQLCWRAPRPQSGLGCLDIFYLLVFVFQFGLVCVVFLCIFLNLSLSVLELFAQPGD